MLRAFKKSDSHREKLAKERAKKLCEELELEGSAELCDLNREKVVISGKENKQITSAKKKPSMRFLRKSKIAPSIDKDEPKRKCANVIIVQRENEESMDIEIVDSPQQVDDIPVSYSFSTQSKHDAHINQSNSLLNGNEAISEHSQTGSSSDQSTVNILVKENNGEDTMDIEVIEAPQYNEYVEPSKKSRKFIKKAIAAVTARHANKPLQDVLGDKEPMKSHLFSDLSPKDAERIYVEKHSQSKTHVIDKQNGVQEVLSKVHEENLPEVQTVNLADLRKGESNDKKQKNDVNLTWSEDDFLW